MICPECGYENLEGEAYCMECGAVLGDETIIAFSDENQNQPKKASLIVEDNEYEIKTGENTVGRENADIVINDPEDYLSRTHCIIVFKNGELSVVDKSLNGTYINGEKMLKDTPVNIDEQDDLRFAKINASVKLN
jgi:pSer/pThr/pTyr-binding forkhead associated (FHA) protein